MNVNINRTGTNPMATVSLASAAEVAAKADVRRDWTVDNLSVTSKVGEAVEGDVPEEELRRDDALGRFVDRVFNFQAPLMPNFQE